MIYKSIAIITPVFNDWPSLYQLLQYIDAYAQNWDFEVQIIAVNDGSSLSHSFPLHSEYGINSGLEFKHIKQVNIISLVCNLGHQRAIAVGLCEAFKKKDLDCVVVMDCDGEDRPEEIEKLVLASLSEPESIIVAQRTKRSESFSFRFLYILYKILFYSLTGKVIDFGNFCLIPSSLLSRIVFISDIWNNLAVTLFKLKVPIHKIKTQRGKRYAGKSKMNLVSLVIHALSAISVYIDVVFVRIIVFFSFLCMLMIMGIAIVITLRFLTDLAVPGWASYTSGLLAILLLQTLMFLFGASFLLLARRTSSTIIPLHDAPKFIRERFTIYPL